jgi:hypothetical protein
MASTAAIRARIFFIQTRHIELLRSRRYKSGVLDPQVFAIARIFALSQDFPESVPPPDKKFHMSPYRHMSLRHRRCHIFGFTGNCDFAPAENCNPFAGAIHENHYHHESK